MRSLGTKKLLGVTVAALLGLGMAGQAQAAPFYTGTVTSWKAESDSLPDLYVMDGFDGDSKWSLLSYDAALADAGVQLSEEEFPAGDWYTVALDFTLLPGGGIQGASYSLTYWAEADEPFKSAHLDSTHVGSGTGVTKEIYEYDPLTDTTGALLLTLNSVDGSTDEGLYAPTRIIKVVETYFAGANGELHESTNSFDVPEPATVALFGLGLLGLGLSRRRAA